MGETMAHDKSMIWKSLLGAAIFTAGVFTYLYGHETRSQKAAPAPTVASLPVPEPTLAEGRPRAVLPPQATVLPPAGSADDIRAEKARLAAEGEAARIALREQRLDALDWKAARPKPSADGDHAESKSERALPVEEKIRQTELVIQRLKGRIAETERPSTRLASTAFDGAVLATRTRQRVVELERRVQLLRVPAAPTTPPAADTEVRVPSTPKEELNHDQTR